MNPAQIGDGAAASQPLHPLPHLYGESEQQRGTTEQYRNATNSFIPMGSHYSLHTTSLLPELRPISDCQISSLLKQ